MDPLAEKNSFVITSLVTEFSSSYGAGMRVLFYFHNRSHNRDVQYDINSLSEVCDEERDMGKTKAMFYDYFS